MFLMRCFPSGPVRMDAGPYKPIGWLLISRCVFLSLTRFSPLHAHRQGHIHIYDTHGNTLTHHIHVTHIDTSLHTHTQRLGDFYPYYWSAPLLLRSPSPAPWVRSPSLSPRVRVRYRGSYQGHVPPLHSPSVPWTSWGNVLTHLYSFYIWPI